MHALADADDQNPALYFFDHLGNPIPYGDTPDDNNEEYVGYLVGVKECNNQIEIPGVTTPDHQEEIIGVTIPEEEEEITEKDIPEEEYENTEIAVEAH